jgi:hypothetical protein
MMMMMMIIIIIIKIIHGCKITVKSEKNILLHVGFPWWHDLCTLMAFP